MPFSRRRFLQLAAAGTVAGAAGGLDLDGLGASSSRLAQVARPRSTYAPAPFSLGVASGDALPDGVVLWTRLVPRPQSDVADQGLPGLVPVDWEIALDEGFATGRRTGRSWANPSLGYSVHVDVRGLDPGTPYWYRFRALNEISPVGRTRTAPADSDANTLVRFASGNCQFFSGDLWYPAWRDVAADDDLDFVVHLGDYIYELSSGSLATFRRLHERYRSDEYLRAAHARHPWFVTWDDHENVNDYSGAPASQGAPFVSRRSAAYQAWYEHMPMRLQPGDTLPEYRIYKRHRWGQLIDLHVLDIRQYRSEQNLPNGTIMGAEQKDWFLGNLAQPDPGWRVVANSIMFSKLERPEGGAYYFTDQWDGFIPERLEVTQFLADASVQDVVIITGDWHSAFVCDVHADFSQPPDPVLNPVVATEFVAHSITSDAYDPATNVRLRAEFAVNNPHILDFEGDNYGYDRYEVTPDLWRTDQRVVATRADPEAPVSTLNSWVVERGQPGVVRP